MTFSTTAIHNAFVRNGYGRHSPLYKPPLNAQQRRRRLEFCEKWQDELRGREHMVIYCDKTTIRIGDNRGQNWVTRLDSERYHPDCIESRYKGYTELMFWGAYIKNELGPYYIFDKETQEKLQSQADLDERNTQFFIELQLQKDQLDQLNESRPKSRKRKRLDKPSIEKLERSKKLKGGIDWYRYQKHVMRPLLLLFIYQIIAIYGHYYLV